MSNYEVNGGIVMEYFKRMGETDGLIINKLIKHSKKIKNPQKWYKDLKIEFGDELIEIIPSHPMF